MTTDTDPAQGDRLAARAARAVAWSYASWISSKLLALVVTAVLARLLTPADFGVVGFATVVVAYLTVVQDVGFGAALIQRRDDVEDAADTAFTVGLLSALALSLLTALGAPAIASWFDAPQVTPMLRVLGLSFVISAVGHTHITMLRRQLQFRRRAVPELGGTVVRGVVAVAAALAGLGPWALIVGQLAGVTTSSVLAWRVEPWRPRLRISPTLIRPMARFGIPLLGANAVHALVANLDYLIVGKVLGEAALGIYTLAYRLPELLLIGVVSVLNRAVFPALAEVQHSVSELRKGFLATMRYVPMAVVPVGVGLIIAAEPIVLVTLGDQWVEAVPVLRCLAAYALVSSLMVADGDVYKATGRSALLARFASLKLILLVPALLIGVHYGLVAVAAAHLGSTIVVKGLRAVVAARILDVRIGDLFSPMRSTVVAAIALVAAATTAMTLLSEASDLIRLLVTAAAGSTAYAAVLLKLEWSAIHRLGALLRRQKA
jgi:O-antigen/teichoic acid export membrane protein